MAGRRGPRNLVFSGSREFFPPPCSLPSSLSDLGQNQPYFTNKYL
jgi:hypothetical protein